MKKIASVFAALLAVLTFVSSAQAGDWMLRERLVNFDPQSNGTDPSSPPQLNFDHATEPEIDAAYFFEKSVAAEFSFTVFHPATTSTVNGASEGDVWILPFTLTLQYYFLSDHLLRPYVGAGMNYTYFSSAGGPHYYNQDFNPVLQFGADLQMTKSWFLNVDVKKIYLSEDISVNGGPKLRNDLYPWIVGVGVGYKF